MRLLIDTHAFLWFIEGDPQLSVNARQLIEDEDNAIWLSIASVWEMAIKFSIGKLTALDASRPFSVQISDQLAHNSISVLPITLPHAFQVASLPFHHRDPFDRLIAAQCLVESLSLLSVDAIFDVYGVARLW